MDQNTNPLDRIANMTDDQLAAFADIYSVGITYFTVEGEDRDFFRAVIQEKIRREDEAKRPPMTMQKLIAKTKRAMADLNQSNYKNLADDFGFRPRATKKAAELGEDVIEIGSTYYYQNQANTDREARNFEFWAEQAGIKVQLSPLGYTTYTEARNGMESSWATQYYQVTFKK